MYRIYGECIVITCSIYSVNIYVYSISIYIYIEHVYFFPKRYAAHIELHVRSSAPKVRSKINDGEESPIQQKEIKNMSLWKRC